MMELPDEIVKGMSPILEKYGVTDKTTQGKIMVKLGNVFQEVNRRDVTLKKNQKRFAAEVYHQTLRTLAFYGVTDMLKRANCAKEILEFVVELIKSEIEKDGTKND